MKTTELENPKRLHPPQDSTAAEQWAFGARRISTPTATRSA
jgi:hypothetical protein